MFVKLNNRMVDISRITDVTISEIKTETIFVELDDNTIHEISGFAAVELIWLLKPSALEGNRNIKWKKHTWAIHNLIAHPVMQILAWCKLYKWAIYVHDITVPKPIDIRRSIWDVHLEEK